MRIKRKALWMVVVAAAAGGFLAVTPASADICYVDDLIVDGSLCVGFDCTCNYSFGFDTIVLKENNLRIFFDDTSTSGSFPTNNWRIIINDSANGGANYFGVEDANAGRRVFSLEAGAPTHSLYVDDGGRLGLGTSTPSTEIHTIDGDTPTLRLQQDGSSGFSPQTWDLAGNETNFFVRDVTNGSTLPFRIRPGASSSVIDISADDEVGINTASPDSTLHVVGDNVLVEATDSGTVPDARFEVRGPTGSANVQLENTSTGHEWNYAVGSGGAYAILLVSDGSSGNELTLRTQGQNSAATRSSNTLDINGGIAADGFNTFSSRAGKEAFAQVDSREVLARLMELPITEWQFKRDKAGARHIGPVAEDFNAAFFGRESQLIALNDASGVALAAIQGLHQSLEDRDSRIEELMLRNEELLERLEALESRLDSGDETRTGR